MKQNSRLFFMFAILFMGLCFHVSFAQAGANTPESVVKNFANAYLMLDASMADYMSEDALVNEDDFNMVELFLLSKSEDARNTGYSLDFYKMKPLLMKTQVLAKDESSATVSLQAEIIRSINPLYRIVGYLFCLLDTQEVQYEISLVNEDGLWKVGPGALDMSY
jgi:hypothetical protein